MPEVKNVPTYTRDYLPTFKIPETYIKGKGACMRRGLCRACMEPLELMHAAGQKRLASSGRALHTGRRASAKPAALQQQPACLRLPPSSSTTWAHISCLIVLAWRRGCGVQGGGLCGV